MVVASMSSKWWASVVAVAAVAISASSALSILVWKKRCIKLEAQIRELEASLRSALAKCSAERQGRIRGQQALRKAITSHKPDKSDRPSYPMRPIGVVESCFSNRNGTPRQPLLVPLARACLLLDTQIPAEALEGLSKYSHCWILYVFHLNTDLEKLWGAPSRMKLKAKVRVPRLNGGKVGVLATRSPHRPCPIGLTVAKIEAVQERMVLLSGIDLVDGTPVLDIKPYLPYSDDIPGAVVPDWLMDDEASSLAVASVKLLPAFKETLSASWATVEKDSLYASPSEFERLVQQILAWDIRSLSQRIRPHHSALPTDDDNADEDHKAALDRVVSSTSCSSQDVTYHVNLEGIDVEYKIDQDANVLVEKATICADRYGKRRQCNYTMWKGVQEHNNVSLGL